MAQELEQSLNTGAQGREAKEELRPLADAYHTASKKLEYQLSKIPTIEPVRDNGDYSE